MNKVIVYGSMNMDSSVQVERLPKKGETINGHSFVLNPGGKGANQSVAAAKSGANTFMIGSVGNDLFGNQLIDSLKLASVNCEYIHKSTDDSTGVATIIRTEGENRIIVSPGANLLLSSDDIAKSLDKIAVPNDFFLSQFETGHLNVLESFIEAKKRKLITVLNPAPAKPIDDVFYPYIDLIIVNQSESEFLTGIYPNNKSECDEVVAFFTKKGVHSIIITLGAYGSFYSNGEMKLFVPSYKVQAIDSTAAGDTYIGTLLYCLSISKEIEESMYYASKAAALTVTKLGAQQSIPYKQDIDNFKEED